MSCNTDETGRGAQFSFVGRGLTALTGIIVPATRMILLVIDCIGMWIGFHSYWLENAFSSVCVKDCSRLLATATTAPIHAQLPIELDQLCTELEAVTLHAV